VTEYYPSFEVERWRAINRNRQIKMKKIRTPLDSKEIRKLKAGDEVLLSGIIYTARDEAHLKLVELIEKSKTFPVALNGEIVYYSGPAPSGTRVIGSCGPTTSSRMDSFTPQLLKAGVKYMIGKGARSKEVARAIKRYSGIYFLAPGGAGAYLSLKVKSCNAVAFKNLGPEAIYRLEVENFPLVVGIDCEGNDVYR